MYEEEFSTIYQSFLKKLIGFFFFFFVTLLLLFYVFWFFGHEACGIPAPHPGIEHAPPALEGEVPTTGLPGKSRLLFLIQKFPFQKYSQSILTYLHRDYLIKF